MLPFVTLVTLCYHLLPYFTLFHAILGGVTMCYPLLLCAILCYHLLPLVTLFYPVSHYRYLNLCYLVLPCVTLC